MGLMLCAAANPAMNHWFCQEYIMRGDIAIVLGNTHLLVIHLFLSPCYKQEVCFLIIRKEIS